MTSPLPIGVVPRFEGEHFFLSNFYEAPFMWRGQRFESGEQAFQYAKVWHIPDVTINEMRAYGDEVLSARPGLAKRLGRSTRLDVKSWDEQKVNYMRSIVHAKFSGVPGLAGQLLNTGAMLLVEGNDWGDKFWGRCLDKTTGKMVGLNTLGTLLMEERGYWLYSDFGDKNGTMD